jgi:hypothetical protein
MTDDNGVLGNLPRSRPGKRSEKRDRSAAAKPAAERGAATERPAKATERAAARAEQTDAAAAKPAPAARQPNRARPRPAAGGKAGGARAAAGQKAAGRKAAGARAAAGQKPAGARAAAGQKAADAREPSDGDPVGDAIRATARLAGTGARVAGSVAHGVLRRIPRP